MTKEDKAAYKAARPAGNICSRDCELKIKEGSDFLELAWYAPIEANRTHGQARSIRLDNPLQLSRLIHALVRRYNSMVDRQNLFTEELATLASPAHEPDPEAK